MGNPSTETIFFEACERGDMKLAKRLLGYRDFDPTKYDGMKKTDEGRPCLHLAVLAGDKVLLKMLVKKTNEQKFTDEGDKQGNTALHLAVWKYRVDLMKVLLDVGKAGLSLKNYKGETPLCIAVKFGFLDAVKELTDPKDATKGFRNPEDVQKLCKDVKVLTLAVEANRVEIVEFLVKSSKILKDSGILKELINQRVDDSGTKRDKETVSRKPIVEGDTPLHIAAKNKNEPIVDLLRKVPGINKHALNSKGETPLDVAREVTEYFESFRIIKRLTDYPRYSTPFMYCAPELSLKKHERAREMVNKSFEERRNAELVVVTLLATMAFTAVFTVPGGLYQDSDSQNKGTPIFLGYYMFKLFIIFDCISFFLSLFVCIMWQMASELTTEDKILFMTLTTLLTCFSFGFNACGFMAAVHTILAHKDPTLAWLILGILLFIDLCGTLAAFHQLVVFAVGRARFHRLCGVPRLFNNFVEATWKQAERRGILNIIRKLDDVTHDKIEGDDGEASHHAIEGEDEHEHGYNCSCSSSPCLRNVPQSV